MSNTKSCLRCLSRMSCPSYADLRAYFLFSPQFVADAPSLISALAAACPNFVTRDLFRYRYNFSQAQSLVAWPEK